MLEPSAVEASLTEPNQTLVDPQLRRALDPRAALATRRRLERDLRAAVAGGGLVLYYQPRLQLASGAIVGAEALLRWPHPRQGLISAATFIPIAERTELATEIGGFVLLAACTEAVQWPRHGRQPAATVSVNVSARQFADCVLLKQLSAALEASGLPPEHLVLELAESMMAEIDLDVLLMLAAIRDLGVGLALDDFGAGFASLCMLKRLPLSIVKIDRSLVRGLPNDREDAAIVQAAIAAGHALGLTIVAEGVETAAQHGFLSDIGCDEGQGFLFSHPRPSAAFATRMVLAAAT